MKLHILILTLPTEQATLRMRVWRALKNTGAAMLRDGVYLLPEAQQSHEIFNEMSREISGEGGTAFVFDAETSDEEKIRPLFDRSQQYLILMESLQVCKNDLNEETAVSQLKMVRKLRRELDRIVAIDFFPVKRRRRPFLPCQNWKLALTGSSLPESLMPSVAC